MFLIQVLQRIFLQQPKKTDFFFLPLGGSGEIGMNLNLYGHNKRWIMVDCGITFHDQHGIDVITPNIDAVMEIKDQLEAIVLTHAHEDHLGAIPYLWPFLECPIYATPFTAQVLRNKLAEKSWGSQVKIHEIPLNGSIELGDFSIEFITLTHSIPEPNALAIRTPLGTVIHTGDWKIDDNPIIGEATNTNRLIEYGNQGIKALVCDSTNIFEEGFTGSENTVYENLKKRIEKVKSGKIVVCCFASNVARVESIIKAAAANDRKVALVGRSLYKMVEAAQYAGYLKTIPKLLDVEDAAKLPAERVLFISTGSQGEPRSALARVAAKNHPQLKLKQGDTVIFSARKIPGNEKVISLMQNRLIEQGVQILSAYDDDIHVSGHPSQEDLKCMYNWTKPECLIPVHGEMMHMRAQANFGENQGIKQTLVPKNGTLIQLNDENPKIIAEIQAGRLGVDGHCLVTMDSIILKQRQKLATQGIVVIGLALNTKQHLQAEPQVQLVGLTEPGDETVEFVAILQQTIEHTLNGNREKISTIKEKIITAVRQKCNQNLGKKPVVEVLINMV